MSSKLSAITFRLAARVHCTFCKSIYMQICMLKDISSATLESYQAMRGSQCVYTDTEWYVKGLVFWK